MRPHTGACEKNTPPEKTRGKMSFRSPKSGGGEQFLPLSRRAKACLKGVPLSQTPVKAALSTRHRGALYRVYGAQNTKTGEYERSHYTRFLQQRKQSEGPQGHMNDSDHERGVGIPTVNLQNKNLQTKNLRVNISRRFPMDPGIPPLAVEDPTESNPPKIQIPSL